MDIARDGEYEEFKTFPDRGPADSLCSWLEFEGVPSYVEPRALSGAMETQFAVLVLKKARPSRSVDHIAAAAYRC